MDKPEKKRDLYQRGAEPLGCLETWQPPSVRWMCLMNVEPEEASGPLTRL